MAEVSERGVDRDDKRPGLERGKRRCQATLEVQGVKGILDRPDYRDTRGRRAVEEVPGDRTETVPRAAIGSDASDQDAVAASFPLGSESLGESR
nr:hypothetical protein [Miltoncostaea oceani]